MLCVYKHVSVNEAVIIQNDDTSQVAFLMRAVSVYGYMCICVFCPSLPLPVLPSCLSSPKAFGKLHLRSLSILARRRGFLSNIVLCHDNNFRAEVGRQSQHTAFCHSFGKPPIDV